MSRHVCEIRQFVRAPTTGGYAAIAGSNGNIDLSPSGVMTSTSQVKLSASSGIEPGITMYRERPLALRSGFAPAAQ